MADLTSLVVRTLVTPKGRAGSRDLLAAVAVVLRNSSARASPMAAGPWGTHFARHSTPSSISAEPQRDCRIGRNARADNDPSKSLFERDAK